jgi:hypothetical protein
MVWKATESTESGFGSLPFGDNEAEDDEADRKGGSSL